MIFLKKKEKVDRYMNFFYKDIIIFHRYAVVLFIVRGEII